jgi:predicted CoA-binding protein
MLPVDHDLHTDAELKALLASTRRIAVLGIKTEAASAQPAYYVPEYLQRAGFDLLPVPVYYPDATHILGQTVYRRVQDVPGPLDLVCVFRRPQDLAGHLEDLLAAAPQAVWLQSGIRSEPFAAALRNAGIAVVQDRCLMVEHRRLCVGVQQG